MRFFSVSIVLASSVCFGSCGVSPQKNRVAREVSALASAERAESSMTTRAGGARNAKVVGKWTSPNTNLEWKVFDSEVKFNTGELDQACKDQGMQVPEVAYAPILEDLKAFANATLTGDDGETFTLGTDASLNFAVRHGQFDFPYDVWSTTVRAQLLGIRLNIIKMKCNRWRPDAPSVSQCQQEMDEIGSEAVELISEIDAKQASAFVMYFPFEEIKKQWRSSPESWHRIGFVCHTIDPNRPAFMDRPTVKWPDVASYL